jgi:hypothetical protein
MSKSSAPGSANDPAVCYIDGTSFATGNANIAGDALIVIRACTVSTGTWGGNTVLVDDFIVQDSSGSDQATIPNPRERVATIRPDGTSSGACNAGDWDSMNDVPFDDSTRCELDTNSTLYTATLGDVSLSGSDTITAVQVGSRLRCETAAACAYDLILNSGGSTVTGNATSNVTTVRTHDGTTLGTLPLITRYTDPNGGTAWTDADIDALLLAFRKSRNMVGNFFSRFYFNKNEKFSTSHY